MSIWRKHKMATLITAIVILTVAVVTALIFSRNIQIFNKATEPVPQGRIHDAGIFGDTVVIHDSTEGEIIIHTAATEDIVPEGMPLTAVPPRLTSNPDTIWTADTYAGNHTPVEKAKMTDGSIGVLTIDKLKLSVNVFESPDAMEDMKKGIAHFPSTSAFDGLVGLSAHNVNFNGSDGFFKYLYTLQEGDAIHYKTALGERAYTVSSITAIMATDWSPLSYQDSNQLALITCISGKPNQRLCVSAMEDKPM